MRTKDIKILWGRSGNRCSICKLELTPDGSKETLGEMAHIVAKSTDGPRGDIGDITDDRDTYENLILLCPTHHKEIDKNYTNWPIDKLKQIKKEHEEWVSHELESGGINIDLIDNSEFLQNRIEAWINMGVKKEAVIISITPLRVTNEILNTLDTKIIDVINSAIEPGNNIGDPVNKYNTRPTEHGIANIRFPTSERRGWGHSFEIFRNGHCEYFY